MRKLLLSLGILFAFYDSFSQKTTRIDNYILPIQINEERLIVISMPFGKSDILEITGDSGNIKNAGEVFVDVVCTDYPSKLSLTKLNKDRIRAFLSAFPFLTTKQLTQINCFRQMDGAEKEKASGMFHGLVVRYRAKQTPEAMKADIGHLDDFIATIERDSAIMVERTVSKADRDSILLMIRLKKGQVPKHSGPVKYEKNPYDMAATGYDKVRRSPHDSMLIISPKAALKKGLITKAAYKAYDWTPSVTLYFHQIGDTIMPIRTPMLTKDITVVDTLKGNKAVVMPDSTLIKIFSRVKWNKYTVVEDVTVSMYPYSAQLLMWIKLHTIDSVANSFVFFNDGDEKPDNEKMIGNTGGLYVRSCNSFDQVKKLMKEAMEKGNGGDRAENNIEALLAGEREFPGNEIQVLVADNMAPIKDKSLSKKLKKPVRVILCGSNAYNVNIDYLNLARVTKGSVHLTDLDIYDLDQLKEGAELKVGKKSFKIEKDSFVENDISEP